MIQRLRQLESLLREGAPGRTRPAWREIPLGDLLGGIVAGGAFYGACMATFGLLRGEEYGWFHLAAVMVKVPALFLLTLLVTAPSLYVFAALARSELKLGTTLRLLLSATAVAVVVLASFGPVTAFFVFSTKSHPFIQVQNLLIFTVAGVVGLRYLQLRLVEVFERAHPAVAEPMSAKEREPLRRASALDPRVWRLFAAWFVIYAVVGAQMAWILRPFIGTPHLDQELFRETDSNIFEGVIEALKWL